MIPHRPEVVARRQQEARQRELAERAAADRAARERQINERHERATPAVPSEYLAPNAVRRAE